MAWTRRATTLASAVVMGGCFSANSGGCDLSSGNGLLGGNFEYRCRSGADPGCDSTAVVSYGTPLPEAVAREASFGIAYDGRGVVDPVSSTVVRRDQGWFRANRAGPVGFVVDDGTELLDAVRLTIVEPTRLVVEPVPTASAPASRGEVGRLFTARAVSYGTKSSGEIRLAGALPVTWTIDPPQPATDTSAPGWVTFHPDRAGTLVLRASFEGKLTGELLITVVPSGTPPPDAGSDGGDASVDADAGEDGGGS